MSRTEKENECLREVQRVKILDGARQVFARKGWSATMAEVATAAKVSQGLAYRYFDSKEIIFKQLIDQAVQSGLYILQHVQEMSGSPGERIKILISMILETKPERVEFYQLFVLTQNDNATPSNIRKHLCNQGKAHIAVLRKLIIEGQATGEIAKGDPDQMVITIIAFLDGLSRFALRNPEQLKEHFPDVGIILRMLKS